MNDLPVGAPAATRALMLHLRIATAIVDACVLIGCWTFPAEDQPLRRAWPMVALSVIGNAAVGYALWR